MSAQPGPKQVPHYRRTSALSAVIWGFPDAHMEAKHWASLHRTTSNHLSLLAAASSLIALAETFKVLRIGDSIVEATSIVVWAAGPVLVNKLRCKQPAFFDAHSQVWPVVLGCTGPFIMLWIAVGLPMRVGVLTLLKRNFGEVAVVASHVAMPAIALRMRLFLGLFVWAFTAASMWAMSLKLATCSTLPCLMLHQVLPCLVGFAISVYHDYKGRVKLLCHSSLGGKLDGSCSDDNTYTDYDAANSGRPGSSATHVAWQYADEAEIMTGNIGAIMPEAETVRYRSPNKCSTLHLKVPSAHPQQLPPDWVEILNDRLKDKLQHCVVNACVREGCIELMLDLRPSSSDSTEAVQILDANAAAKEIIAILGDWLPHGGKIIKSLPLDDGLVSRASGPALVLTQLSPCVVLSPSAASHSVDGPLTFTVQGSHLHAAGTEIVVVCQGRHIPVTMLDAEAGQERGCDSITVSCPWAALPRTGVLRVFSRRSGFTSNGCSLVLLPCPGMVSELSQLPQAAGSQQDLQVILCDLGHWMDVVQTRLAAHTTGQLPQPAHTQRLDIAAGSVDLTQHMSALLVREVVEQAVAPIGKALLTFFSQLGWKRCACAVLSDLLNPDLGWSVMPHEMWKQLNQLGSAPLVEWAASCNARLAQQLSELTRSSDCVARLPAGQRSPTYLDCRLSSSLTTSSGDSCPGSPVAAARVSQPIAAHMAGSSRGHREIAPKVAPRPTSALHALLCGFPNPQMEAAHRMALHKESTTYTSMLAGGSFLIAMVEVLRVAWVDHHLTKAMPLMVWAAGYIAVNQIRMRLPRVHNTYCEAWPLLLNFTNVFAPVWIAAGLPFRAATLALKRSTCGQLATLIVHVALPAISGRMRLALSIWTWLVNTFVHVYEARQLDTYTTTTDLLLCHVLPCLVGFGLTVYHDYQARRRALMCVASHHKKA